LYMDRGSWRYENNRRCGVHKSRLAQRCRRTEWLSVNIIKKRKIWRLKIKIYGKQRHIGIGRRKCHLPTR
jgi:hypothetical protein